MEEVILLYNHYTLSIKSVCGLKSCDLGLKTHPLDPQRQEILHIKFTLFQNRLELGKETANKILGGKRQIACV